MVSISVGGDNSDIFTNVINKCVVTLYTAVSDCKAAIDDASKTVATLQPDLEAVYHEVKTKGRAPGSPDRAVFVLGYAKFYNLLPKGITQKGSVPIPATIIRPISSCPPGLTLPTPSLGIGGISDQINQLVVAMNTVIQKACTAQNVKFVDIDAAFEGHRMCDGEENNWFQIYAIKHLFGQFIFHPTEKGSQAMANELAKSAGY